MTSKIKDSSICQQAKQNRKELVQMSIKLFSLAILMLFSFNSFAKNNQNGKFEDKSIITATHPIANQNEKTEKKLLCINADGTNSGEVQHKIRDVFYIIKEQGEWTSINLNQVPEAIKAMLKSGLYSEKDFNIISNLASEKTYPLAISTYMLREKNRSLAQNYTCLRIAQFETSYAHYSVLWIPKEDNTSLPKQMQPTLDNGFYMVIKTSSIATVQQPSTQNAVVGLENGTSVNGVTSSGMHYTTTSGNVSTSSFALDIFSELGSMAIYQGSTMYVVKIKGKQMQDHGTVAARANQLIGFTTAHNYQWFSGKNCTTLKSQYGANFTVICQGVIDLDK